MSPQHCLTGRRLPALPSGLQVVSQVSFHSTNQAWYFVLEKLSVVSLCPHGKAYIDFSTVKKASCDLVPTTQSVTHPYQPPHTTRSSCQSPCTTPFVGDAFPLYLSLGNSCVSVQPPAQYQSFLYAIMQYTVLLCNVSVSAVAIHCSLIYLIAFFNVYPFLI